MRSCLAHLAWIALAAACAYSVWQVRLLREDVDQLRSRLGQVEAGVRESMLDDARAALDAFEQGDLAQAGRELDELRDKIELAQAAGLHQRERVQSLLDEARVAVAQGSAQARELLRDLEAMLSRSEREERGQEPGRRNPEHRSGV